MPQGLHQLALDCLRACDPAAKAARVHALQADWHAGRLGLHGPPPERIVDPGRPVRPQLVSPSQLQRRSTASQAGRTRLAHALAHIEFNAINLAVDAVYRFRDMPTAFYSDWLHVAAEEARHFDLLCECLHERGSAYGDYPAHAGLWDMAHRTDHDLLARLALVPCVLEARGLDVTPGMIERLQRAGDQRLVAILERIYRDEIGHVRIGNHWFEWLCQQRGEDAVPTFSALVTQHFKGPLRGPYNLAARREAGFSERQLEALSARAASRPGRTPGS